MAATVEGVFRIIDRASGPMSKIEGAGKRLKKVLDGAGDAMDRLGRSNAWRRVSDWARSFNVFNRSVTQTSRSLNRFEQDNRRASRSVGQLGSSLVRATAALGGFRIALGALKLVAAIGAITGLIAVVGQLAGGLFALTPAIAQAGAAFAALPAMIGGAVQGMVGFMGAMGGVSAAVSAGIEQQRNAGLIARDTALRQQQASDQIRAAERAVYLAQRNSGDAQRALNDERRQAIRDLQDMRMAAQSAALGEEGAALALRRARQALRDAQAGPGSSMLDIAEARFGVKQAQFAAKQARVENNRAQEDARRAEQRGWRNSERMIAARRAVADSSYEAAEASRALSRTMQQVAREERQGSAEAEAYRLAMAQLSPEAQSFARSLINLRPQLVAMRAEIGRDLFPALERGLGNLQRAFPVIQRTLRQTGGVVGGEMERASRRFTTGARLGDAGALGALQNRILRLQLRGLTNLGEALMDVMVAAEPFTRWLANTIYRGTVWVREWARAGRETGRFADFLDGTRRRLRQFGEMAKDAWSIVTDLGRAATPLGDRLWRGARRALDGWADYLDSAKGAREAQGWFSALYDPLHELGQLGSDLAGMFGRMAVNPSFTNAIRALRESLPSVESLATKSADMLPSFVRLFDAIVSAIDALPIQPLQVLVNAFTRLMQAVDWLLRNVPGLGNLLSGLLMASVIGRSISMMGTLIGKWRTLIGLQTVAGARGGVPPIAGGGGMVMPVGRAGIRGNYGYLRQSGMGRLGAARMALAEGGGGFMGGAGRLGMGALRGAGRAFAPLAVGLGAMDFLGTQGTFNERLQAMASGMTLGIIPRGETGIESGARGEAAALAVAGRGHGAVEQRIATLQTNLAAVDPVSQSVADARRSAGMAPHPGIPRLQGDLRERTEAQLKALREIDQQMDRERRQRLRAMSERHGYILSDGFARAFRIYSKANGPEAAMELTSDRMIDRMGGMRRRGAVVMAQNTLAWAQGMADENPALQGVVDDMEAQIKRKFRRMGMDIRIINGEILTGSRTQWQRISQALRDPVERAKSDVTAGFTAMERKAIGSLRAMGFSDADARKILKGTQTGGMAGRVAAHDVRSGPTGAGQSSSTNSANMVAGHARGGRIQGMGLHDTVPVAPGALAAPGELIVNRHTENRIRRQYGVDLGAEVAGETRPHYSPMMSFDGDHSSHTFGGRVTFARGGRQRNGSRTWNPSIGTAAFTDWLIRNYAPGLSRGSGYRSPAHNAAVGGSPTSDHMKGTVANPGAWDVPVDAYGPQAHLGDALAQAARASGVAQVLWRVADHFDHVHLGFGAVPGEGFSGMAGVMALLGMGGGKGFERIRAPRSGVGGVPGALANRALAGMAAGLNRRLRGAAGGGGGMLDGSVPEGGVRAWLTKALRITGHFSPANLQALYGRAMQESGGNPRAINLWDSNAAAGIPSKGLLQTIDPTFAAHALPGMNNIWNPVHNAVAAIRYMFSRYGHIVGPSSTGYELGGRIPEFGGWHANTRGTMRFNKPTLIGVGDGHGGEDVTISKAGAGGGGVSLSVTIGHIDYRQKGDIRKVVEEELRGLAEDIVLVGGGGR